MKYKETHIDIPRAFTKDWKFYTGLSFFVFSIIMPVFALLIPFLHLSPGVSAALIALTIAGGPEIALILAAIFWGKETLNYFKNKVFTWLKRFFKNLKPPQYVGKTQYYIWLLVWIFSGVPGIIDTYFPDLIFPEQQEQKIYLAILLDSLFVVSFFMLGGQFWDKIGAIFRYDAPAEIPSGPKS